MLIVYRKCLPPGSTRLRIFNTAFERAVSERVKSDVPNFAPPGRPEGGPVTLRFNSYWDIYVRRRQFAPRLLLMCTWSRTLPLWKNTWTVAGHQDMRASMRRLQCCTYGPSAFL